MTASTIYKPVLIQHGEVKFSGSFTDFALPDAVGAPDSDSTDSIATYFQGYDFEIRRESVRNLGTHDRRLYTQASQSKYFTVLRPTAHTSVSRGIDSRFTQVSDVCIAT